MTFVVEIPSNLKQRLEYLEQTIATLISQPDPDPVVTNYTVVNEFTDSNEPGIFTIVVSGITLEEANPISSIAFNFDSSTFFDVTNTPTLHHDNSGNIQFKLSLMGVDHNSFNYQLLGATIIYR